MSLTLTLAVDDLDHTEQFYREVLDLPLERLVPAPGFPPLLLLTRGDATILFRAASALEASHPALFQHLGRHPRGIGMTLELQTDDLARPLRNLARCGHHLLYELEDAEHRRREAWLHDPDGYLLILTQEPDAVSAPGGEPDA